MTYPLGWSIVTQMLIRRERWPGGYKTRATPLVDPGQQVQPDQPVMRIGGNGRASADLPTQNVGVPLAGTPEAVARRAGTGTGAPEASTPVPRLSLPMVAMENTLRGVNRANGAASAASAAPETIPAGLRGRVVDITPRGGVVIETRAAVVQGALGAGNQVAGILTLWQPPSPTRAQQQIPPGAILVIPGPLNFAMLRQAMSSGVAGVVASSVSSRDLEGFLRTDLISLINSRNAELAQVHLPPLTLLFTEGLGTLAMPARTITLLGRLSGSIALISGATSVQQSIFPELIISLPAQEALRNWHPIQPDPTLAVGAQVRICSGEHEGAIGEIEYLFTRRQTFPSGVQARAARLRLEDGSNLVIPLTLIERIE